MVTPNAGKGDGSLYYDATQKRWCGTVTLPPVNGKRRRKTVSAQTREEAAERLAALKRQVAVERLNAEWGDGRRAGHPEP